MFSVVRYAAGEGARVGVLVDDRLLDAGAALAALLGEAGEMQAVVARWEQALPLMTALARSGQAGQPLADARLLAPLPRPVNLYCAFANYVDHMLEMGGTPADKNVEDPFLFQTPSTAVTDPEAAI